VPRDLETICLKCLGKEPQRRYASARALADELRRFQEGRPIQARPTGWGGHLWRWARRNPAAAALVAAALALVGLAVGGGLWLEQQQAERRAETARQEGRTWQAMEAALAQAAMFRRQGRWPEAQAAREGGADPAGRVGPGRPPRTAAPGACRHRHRVRTRGDPAAPVGRPAE
jgi:serine/threonine-protein kinase